MFKPNSTLTGFNGHACAGDTAQPRSPMTGRFATKTNAEETDTLSFKLSSPMAHQLRQLAAERRVTLSALLRLMVNQLLSGDVQLLDLPEASAPGPPEDPWGTTPAPKTEPPQSALMLEMLQKQQEAMAAQQLELTKALAQIALARPELPPVQAVSLPPLEVECKKVNYPKRWVSVKETCAALLMAQRQFPELEIVTATWGRVYARLKSTSPKQMLDLWAFLEDALQADRGSIKQALWLQGRDAVLPKKALEAKNQLIQFLAEAEQLALAPARPALTAAEIEWVD